MTAVEFWGICSMNGLALSNEQMEAFARFAEDLVYWNDRVNLISRRDTPHIWSHHLLHSITPLLMKLMRPSGRVLDIGSGGGLPGLPLKIAAPAIDVLMIDSIAKKVNTTSMLASHIAPHGAEALRTRAEELVNLPGHAGSYHTVVARAVAPLVDLLGWVRPLLRPDGVVIALKGGELTDEIDHARGKHPDAVIEIIDIDLVGYDAFKEDGKRIVTVRFPAADGTLVMPSDEEENVDESVEAEVVSIEPAETVTMSAEEIGAVAAEESAATKSRSGKKKMKDAGAGADEPAEAEEPQEPEDDPNEKSDDDDIEHIET